MFLNKPHFAHRHESFLLKEFSNKVFQETQSKLPYFVASYTFYKLEKLFREENFHPELKPYKAHLVMIFRESIAGICPNLNFEKPIDEHSLKVINILKNEIALREHFDEVANIFKKTSLIWTAKMNKSKFAMKDVSDFTELLLIETNRKIVQPITTKNDGDDYIYKGDVLKVMPDKFGNFFGFIRRQPNNIFFHSRKNKSLNFTDLEGKFVTYKVSSNPKNEMVSAIDVEIAK